MENQPFGYAADKTMQSFNATRPVHRGYWSNWTGIEARVRDRSMSRGWNRRIGHAWVQAHWAAHIPTLTVVESRVPGT